MEWICIWVYSDLQIITQNWQLVQNTIDVRSGLETTIPRLWESSQSFQVSELFFFVSWSFSLLGYLVVGDYEDGFLTGKEQVFFYSLSQSVFARSAQGTTIYALRALGIQKQNDNKLFVRISWETWTPPPRQCTEWKTQLALPEYSSTTLFSERGTQSLFLLEICAIF